MKIITENVLGQPVTVDAFKKFRTVDIKAGWHKYPMMVYSYTDPSNNIPPFINFNNDSLCLYCNNPSLENYESLSKYSQDLLNFFAYQLSEKDYNNNFRTFDFDNKTYKFTWELGKEEDVKFSPDNDREIIVTTNGTRSHWEMMTQILREQQEAKLINRIFTLAKKMGLQDKIKHVMIKDPNTKDWYNYSKSEPAVSVGVLGTNYTTKTESKQIFNKSHSKNRCVVLFSPFIYFMKPLSQDILIIHELCHILVGNNHQHDKYFWHMFEKFSGLKKVDKENWCYDEDEEKQDTIFYDDNYAVGGLSVEKLVNLNPKTR